MRWKDLFNFLQRCLRMTQQTEAESQETMEEKYIIAKCIGCGQCKEGCPVKVKVKVKKKLK